MDITIPIPNNKSDIIKAALDYKDEIRNGKGVLVPNPQTALEFLEEWIILKIKREVDRYIDKKPENKSDWKFKE